MSEQADLTGISLSLSKREKGAEVFRRLREVADRTQPAVCEQLKAAGLAFERLWVANMIVASGNEAVVRNLAARDDVARIFANPEVFADLPNPGVAADRAPAEANAVEWGVTKVRAPEVWALGFTGQNTTVGGIDTGYQWDHPALKNQYRGWDGTNADHSYNWHDAIHATGGSCVPNSAAPCDDHGHGTHTIGTAVGGDGSVNQIGMAPGARWIGARCMKSGAGTPATYLECLQWMLAPTAANNLNPDPSRAPDVIVNSWGCPASEDCVDPDVILPAVRSLRAAGIVVVASAGNYGSSCSTIRDPIGIHDASFTVGNTDSSDNIASTSSRGPVTSDGSGRLKPDISAPGQSVRSSYPVNTYTAMSGTSMACPHVAGLVALMLSANPNLAGNVDAIERLIEEAAVPRTSAQNCGGVPGSQIPNNAFGYGRIDALAAVTAALAWGCAPSNVAVASASVRFGSRAALSARSEGKPPLHYQWFQGENGAPVGADAGIFLTPALSNLCVFRVLVSNECGFAFSTTATVTVFGAAAVTHYVSLSGSHEAPFTNWMTAATDIQSAIGACAPGDLVLVSNGIYNAGSSDAHTGLLCRIAVTNQVAVRSVNGPAMTIIEGAGPLGAGAIRCAFVSAGSLLDGFTLTNGFTHNSGAAEPQRGGGVWCEEGAEISNCVIAGNAAALSGGGAYRGLFRGCEFSRNSAKFGGGAFEAGLRECRLLDNAASPAGVGGGSHGGTLVNCLIAGNSAQSGGGCAFGNLINCTVADNAAEAGGLGGGLFGGTARNCIVYYNTRTGEVHNLYQSVAEWTCTTPEAAGAGNITNAPLFSGYRPASNSPCVDAGTPASESVQDLEGVPRPLDGNNDGVAAWDMGAFEFMHPLADSDRDALLDTNELALGTSPVLEDTDGDYSGDGAELAAGTDPLNPASFLGIQSIETPVTQDELVIQWSSVTGRWYAISRSTNFEAGFDTRVATNIPASAPLNAATITPAGGMAPSLYRVEVE